MNEPNFMRDALVPMVIEQTGNSAAPAQMEIGSTLQIYGLKK